MYNYLFNASKENLEQLFETLPEKLQGALIGMDIMLKNLQDRKACLEQESEFAEDTLEKIRYEVKIQNIVELYNYMKIELYENFLAFLEREA